jgi:hypothetical protein
VRRQALEFLKWIFRGHRNFPRACPSSTRVREPNAA